MNKYTRFFEATSPSFLFESIYVNSYKDLNCCAIKEGESVIIFFKNLDEEKCQKRAMELLGNNEKFEKFLNNAKEIAENLIKEKKRIKLINLFMDFLNFYRYTESFYTELAYKTSKNENNKILENNLIKLEKIKTEGRK